MFRVVVQTLPQSRDLAVAAAGTARRSSTRRRDGEALRVIREGIRRLPTSPHLHANEALILQQMGRNDEAIAAYQRELLIEPGEVPVYVSLSALLAQTGRKTEARKVIDDDNRVDRMYDELLTSVTTDMIANATRAVRLPRESPGYARSRFRASLSKAYSAPPAASLRGGSGSPWCSGFVSRVPNRNLQSWYAAPSVCR